MQNSFQSLGLDEDILQALEAKGYTTPTPIQSAVIPGLLNSNINIMGQARTGTGKTAAFGIPILQKCDSSRNSVQALVLAPTRELAVQVCTEMQSMQGKNKLKFALLYGGQGMASQIQTLRKGAHIVVGTPGRILDHIRSGRLSLDELQYLVLDEADRMLDMGFQEDLEAIVASAPEERQTLMFSATFTGAIRKAATSYMKEFEMVQAEDKQVDNRDVRMIAYEVYEKDKKEALCRILHTSPDFYGIIFCARKAEVDDLAQYLSRKGFAAEGLHGDMSQPAREKVLGRLKKGKLRVLVATDVAARGIDVNDLGYVVHYNRPDSADALTHRTGRTARAGKSGTSICIIAPSEASRFRALEKRTGFIHERIDLPEREDVRKARMESARQAVERGIGKNPTKEYVDFARQLLDSYEAEDLVASLLRDRLGDTLLESSLPEISVPAPHDPKKRSGKRKTGGEGSRASDSSKDGQGFRSRKKAANRKRKYSGSFEGGAKPRGKLKKSGAGRK
ncbi:MAG: DEAD/DEAH box helicase [Leptospiraceae bacterium]|nr:DEAD/DEAH box helicase [Leptospiraceae bacterium]